MFKKNTNPVVEWPVSIAVAADGGAIAHHLFKARFKRRPPADLIDIFSGIIPDAALTDGASGIARHRASLLAPIIEGWSELADESGQPLAYSPAELESLLAGPDGNAFWAGFGTALQEIVQARSAAKNFSPLAAPGQNGGLAASAILNQPGALSTSSPGSAPPSPSSPPSVH